MNKINLDAEYFDRFAKLAAEQGITPGEYLIRALEAYERYHHPQVQGRLHPCVGVVPCPLCKAAKGEPCKSKTPTGFRYTQETHVYRRNDYMKIKDQERRTKREETQRLLAEKRRARTEKHAKKLQAVKDRFVEARAER